MMTGSVFFETLRRKWRSMLYWGIGIGLWATMTFLFLPNTEGLQQYVELMENLNVDFMAAFGVEDAALMGTPEGFIGIEFFSWIVLVLAVYGVLAGQDFTANDEDNGTMDLLLSLPLARWQIVLEKMLAYSLMLVVICLISFVGLVVGVEIAPNPVSIPAVDLLKGTLNIVPSTLLIMIFTAFVATVVRRKSTALAISGVFVIASYLLYAIGSAAGTELADKLIQVSWYTHYGGSTVLSSGLIVSGVIGLLAAAVVLAAGAVTFFERRDVAV